MRILPMLFNERMVKAILNGDKKQTRRVARPQPNETFDRHWECFTADNGEMVVLQPPCRIGDILYVRETWQVQSARRFDADARVCYLAGGSMTTIQFPGRKDQLHNRAEYDAFISKWMKRDGWIPSIHMPKEAARIFLEVTEVRMELLQEIKNDECVFEGAVARPNYTKRHDLVLHDRYRREFAVLWDSTVDPAKRNIYGWDANPWVWVICFQRCLKPEGWP